MRLSEPFELFLGGFPGSEREKQFAAFPLQIGVGILFSVQLGSDVLERPLHSFVLDQIIAGASL